MSSIEDLLQANPVKHKDTSSQPADLSVTQKEPIKIPINSGQLPQKEEPKSKDPFAKESKELDTKIADITTREHEQELEQQAANTGLSYVNLKGIPVSADVLRLLDLEFCTKNRVMCFYYAPHERLRIAIEDGSQDTVEQVKANLPEIFQKTPQEWFLTSKDSFKTALEQYERLPKVIEPDRGVEVTADEFANMSDKIGSLQDIQEKMKDVSISQLVTMIVAAGIKTKASDIHIEAEVDGIKLRYRIDGVLHTAATLEKSVWHQMISRIKLLAELKLNITEKPQDGRFSIFLKEEKLDVRLSTLPTSYGESVVMRLLRSQSIRLEFKDIGLSDKYLKMLNDEISRPNGMIITTGPTGSGKTTTLYTILGELNKPETKIITVEDPVEYELQGINQSQVDAAKDYTFSKGLRSIVRQDPDVVMVGEMRDLETVDIALNAALTGHLVLSTLHTNDAAGAIPRFLAMGAKPYLLAPALNLIMAQRLVRKLCDHCKQEEKLPADIKQKIIEILKDIPDEDKQGVDVENGKFYKAGKCEKCNQLGYKGRIGIFEMFNMTREIEQIILSNEVSEYSIREIAIKDGMISMVADGIIKAASGITSIEEVFRVTE